MRANCGESVQALVKEPNYKSRCLLSGISNALNKPRESKTQATEHKVRIMVHMMFDVDGTLVQSVDADAECYAEAVNEVTGFPVDTDWAVYQHATDLGVLLEHLKRHGLEAELDEYSTGVKQRFTELLSIRIREHGILPVPGAAGFLDSLRGIPDISLSIATGGWWDTASLKLTSAGIDVSGIPNASSDDHYARNEIMKISASRSGLSADVDISYFGDGSWDKAACDTLGYNFILVGSGRFHEQRIADYTDTGSGLVNIPGLTL